MNPWEAPEGWRTADHRYPGAVANGPVPDRWRNVAKALIVLFAALGLLVTFCVTLMWIAFSNDGP